MNFIVYIQGVYGYETFDSFPLKTEVFADALNKELTSTCFSLREEARQSLRKRLRLLISMKY